MSRLVARVLISLAFLVTPLLAAAPTAAAPPEALTNQYFFAEGSTNPPFDTWVLLFNPNPNPANVAVSFVSNGGSNTRVVTVGPNSRFSIYVNQVLPNANFGTIINSSLPIAAERAMYFRQDGTAVKGITQPSTTWLFGEGATAFPHQTWFLMMNPSPSVTANVTMQFNFEGGGSQTSTVAIPPLSRVSIFANQILPPAAFSTRITSDQPIVAERSMFKVNDGSGDATQGATAPAANWYFAEGSTNPPFQTWFLVYNPNPTPAGVNIKVTRDDGNVVNIGATVAANSRASFFMNQIQPGTNFGAQISGSQPIVAERSMFFKLGSHNTLGSPDLATTWYLAEGATAPPFDEWVLLANPNATAATATLTFSFPDGSTGTRTQVIGANSRVSLFLNQLLPPTAVSTRVDSNLPIVVERSMYFRQGGTNTNGLY